MLNAEVEFSIQHSYFSIERIGPMRSAVVARRLVQFVVVALVWSSLASCTSPGTAPTLVLKNDVFTGTLQPLGADSKNFTVTFSAAPTDLNVTVNSLTAVTGGTPVTGVTVGIGLGLPTALACAVQVLTPNVALGQKISLAGGISAGTYCVQISDCPTGSTGCTSQLTQPVTYNLTVAHY
jgi:hypothetical protein